MTKRAAEHAIRAVARGRVQGVGYRQSVVERSTALGVLGWVRNDDDGSVRVHAEGAQAAVDQLAAFLWEGPPAAQVEAVEVDEVKVEGHEQFAVRGVSAGRFVVEGPRADGAAGYVLRLEVDGAWRSWAMRREPSMVPAEKRFASLLAADADDGDAAAAHTHGAGDAGNTGGAEPWDGGTYEQGGRVAWPEAIERGHAVFVLHGEHLQGGFALQRTRPGQWLLIKRRDEFARAAGQDVDASWPAAPWITAACR